MTASDLNKLSVFHTKSLRRILRIFWPKTISNGQLLDRCRQDIMETIRELKMETFSGDGDRTGRDSLELRQPWLPIKNRTLRSQ